MENNKEKCRIGERVYSSGERVCDAESCYLCRAGEWELSSSNFIGVGP